MKSSKQWKWKNNLAVAIITGLVATSAFADGGTGTGGDPGKLKKSRSTEKQKEDLAPHIKLGAQVGARTSMTSQGKDYGEFAEAKVVTELTHFDRRPYVRGLFKGHGRAGLIEANLGMNKDGKLLGKLDFAELTQTINVAEKGTNYVEAGYQFHAMKTRIRPNDSFTSILNLGVAGHSRVGKLESQLNLTAGFGMPAVIREKSETGEWYSSVATQGGVALSANMRNTVPDVGSLTVEFNQIIGKDGANQQVLEAGLRSHIGRVTIGPQVLWSRTSGKFYEIGKSDKPVKKEVSSMEIGLSGEARW